MTIPLDQQLSFLREIDALKSVIRASPLINQSRKENAAEHSWHLAMYALILAEHSNEKINVDRVIRMLLIHDIVEIDAGDTPIHGNSLNASTQVAKERKAADRIFGMLPPAQAASLKNLWMEFEAATSDDAKFAKSLDRLQPLVHNIETDGGTWKDADVSFQQVLDRYGPPIESGSSTLWNCAKRFVKSYYRNS